MNKNFHLREWKFIDPMTFFLTVGSLQTPPEPLLEVTKRVPTLGQDNRSRQQTDLVV